MRDAAGSKHKVDFNERPFIAIWEATQACDLACVHCRASAQPLRSSFELSTAEAQRLIEQIAEMQVPVFVITGGDPLKRPDIFDLVEYATARGVRTSLTPSATPLLTREAIAELQQRGLARLAVSLDGPTAEIHDAFRRVPGSYEWTLRAVRWARELGLPVQINTTITRRNMADFDDMARLLEALDIAMWSVFFLVPIGRGQLDDLISAEEFRNGLRQLHQVAARARFDIKTTEAQHYRRYVLQTRVATRRNRGLVQRLPGFTHASYAYRNRDGERREWHWPGASWVERRQGFHLHLPLGRGFSQRLPPDVGRQRAQAIAGGNLPALAAVCFLARRIAPAREVRRLRIPERVRRLAGSRLCPYWKSFC